MGRGETMKWISPMQFIFGWFGYVKVSKAVVQLSMKQEDSIKDVIPLITNPDTKEWLETLLKAQRTITNFLRSGKLLAK
jgi:hypothetical protein